MADTKELRASLEAAEEMVRALLKENETLRARIEATEKQQPACVTTKAYLAAMKNGGVRYIVGRDPVFSTRSEDDVPLYLAAGAKGEEK